MQPNRCLAPILTFFSFGALVGPGQAQITAAPASPAPASPNPAVSAPVSPVLDLLPLKKALLPLAGDGVLKSQSNFQMTGSKQGISFTFREVGKIVAKRPGRFRAELTQFSADNQPKQRLTVISDGVSVWTYRPGTHQYSVTPYKTFQEANNDVTALGLAIGGFFLGDGHQLAQGFQGLTRSNSAEVLSALEDMGITISSKTESMKGEDVFLYRMTLIKQGLSYRFVVDSASNKLRRVDLSGTQKGVEIAFSDEITHLAPLITASKTMFKFTPPVGATKVTTLSVDPF